jgi:small subunit ribosomal protein S13
MPRIAGINIPNDKRVEIALTYIYGIGKTTSNKILEQASIDKNIRIKDLSNEDLNKLRNVIEKSYKIEGDLRREILLNIKRLKEIKSYRGSRHSKGLPARGQRTKTNSRTRRGNKRGLATSGKKPIAQKT